MHPILPINAARQQAASVPSCGPDRNTGGRFSLAAPALSRGPGRTIGEVCDAEFAGLLSEAERRANALIARERFHAQQARAERHVMAWCSVGFFVAVLVGFAL